MNETRIICAGNKLSKVFTNHPEKVPLFLTKPTLARNDVVFLNHGNALKISHLAAIHRQKLRRVFAEAALLRRQRAAFARRKHDVPLVFACFWTCKKRQIGLRKVIFSHLFPVQAPSSR